MAIINGTPNNDSLDGTAGNDTINGFAGNDELNGFAGNDLLNGDEDGDLLRGGEGNDGLFGGKGNDNLGGDEGDDDLFGGEGDDDLFGGVGDDTINGDEGNDNLGGGEGNDDLRGDGGNDTLIGGAGNDFSIGGEGDDFIVGGEGDDSLIGLSGNDSLIGSEGDDSLIGGEGEDIFVLVDNEKIEDFVVGEDVIRLDGLSSGNAIAYDPQSGDLLLNGTTIAQILPTELTFESGSFNFNVDRSDLTLNIPFADDGDNGGNNDFVDLSNIIFTNRSDVVEKKDVILIPGGSFVSTLAGDDRISSIYITDTPTISLPAPEGSREVVFGIYNQESLDTSFGNDVILGDVKYTGESLIPAVYGITQAFNGVNNDFTSATISTGSGNDKVSGLATSSNSTDIVGISNLFSSEIDTGAGRDEVRGEASGAAINNLAGISQTTNRDLSETNNLIVTGNGSDKVIGVGDGTSERNIEGISQEIGNNQLITGNGNDEIRGKAGGSSGFLGGITQSEGENQIITGNGSDKVIGEADGNASVSLLGILQGRGNNQIITDNGNDKVIGKANGNLEVISGELGGTAPGMVGISQRKKQEISTGNGSDEVIGEASGTATSDNPSSDPAPIVGIAKSNSTIETGNGNDKVIGEGSGTADIIAGIAQQGSEDLIITENGNDEVIGKASGIADAPDFSALMAGIAQQPGTAGSQIITGKGNDKVEGTAENNGRGFTAGILGDLDILTGEGNDKVIASAKLFGKRVDGFAADPFTGGTVTVDTGSGNDLVKGFGQGNFDGGKGNRDVYDLCEYHKSEFKIEIGAGGNNEVNFTHTDDFGESTAFTQGFEVFRFADGELSFSDLA